jgi:hypothetical protein
MTSTEAKQVLLAYRRDRADEYDPALAEALRLAAKDAELREWLEAQQQFQEKARQELRSIQPPADLKASILANLKSASSETAETRAIAKPNFRAGPLLALAAAIALVLGASLWLFRGDAADESFSAFRSRMVNFALRTYQMDIVTNNPAAVRQFIDEHGGAADFKMPANLEKVPVQGGGRLSWQNHPVSMICYTLPDRETLFVFVVDRDAMHGKIPSERANVQTDKRLNTVSFTRDGHTFLLAAKAPPETLLTLAADSPPAP